MNKIEKVLLDSVKEIKGTILGFGNLSDKVITAIDKNDNIIEFTLLSNSNESSGDTKGRNTKKVPYHKIRKKFRKKDITSIIASYDDLQKYRRRFIADSLFLAKDNIYLFIKSEDIDVEIIQKRYERYRQECEMIPCRDGFLLKITKKNYKKNKVRDTWYIFLDFIIDILNIIGDLFVS